MSHFLPELLSGLSWRGSLEQFALALPYKAKQLDLVDLLNTIACLGWSAKPLRQHLDRIDRRLLPVIFVPDGSSAQQLGPLLVSKSDDPNESEGIRCFRCGDDGIAPLELQHQTFGSAYVFNKVEQVASGRAEESRSSPSASWFRGIIERFRPAILQIFVLSLILNVISLATPVFVMMVYDVIIGGLSTNGLDDLLLGVSLAICVEFALRFLR
ncbi:MAG: hypothetical protein ACR2Q4_07080, partial [Geminicoccaceae bacterium]